MLSKIRSLQEDDAESRFVCPLCGTGFDTDRRCCTRCSSTIVVPVGERQVYETILPLCEPRETNPAEPEASTVAGSRRTSSTPSATGTYRSLLGQLRSDLVTAVSNRLRRLVGGRPRN